MSTEQVGICTWIVQVDCIWNVMEQAQKPDFVFLLNGRVHLNRRGRQFSRLLAAEVCATAVVMLATPCFKVVWRVMATHSIRQFLLHFPSRASSCSIMFQLESTRFGLLDFGTKYLQLYIPVLTARECRKNGDICLEDFSYKFRIYVLQQTDGQWCWYARFMRSL
jgi:hypothetical protein